MPITSSAKKALRASRNKRMFNMRRKDEMGAIIKQIRRLIAEKKSKEAATLLPKVFKALDKAAKTNLIKKNTAARKKSRLAKLINKATA